MIYRGPKGPIIVESPELSSASNSDSSHRLHENVGALKKFIFGVNSGVRVQVGDSDSLIGLSSLGFRENRGRLHREVGEHWHPLCVTLTFLNNVLPEWFVHPFLLKFINILAASSKQISS